MKDGKTRAPRSSERGPVGEGFGRREFLTGALAGLVSASVGLGSPWRTLAAESEAGLPMGSGPEALNLEWFPSRLHAFVWRNWGLAKLSRMAKVVGAKESDLEALGASMGLEPARGLTDDERRRAGLTIIRRNWHLLPYEQMLELLGWTATEMAYTLREDDFFFIKLGSLKPRCAPLRWGTPGALEAARAEEIVRTVKELFPKGEIEGRDRLFSFVKRLSAEPVQRREANAQGGLRLGYSYFALYGDPLFDPSLDPYPDGYLARLAAAGVNAVWLQGVLGRLSPLPWGKEADIEKRRNGLQKLVSRARRHGIQIFLYLNEPRALPAASPEFEKYPEWRGTAEGDYAAICTSVPVVRSSLRKAVTDLCREVPDLGGFFMITASENLTNCWSHHRGGDCPRCKGRSPAEVIAEVNATFYEGIRGANGKQRLLAWDWGWQDSWAADAIERLPEGIELMSVSEWSLPIERGGVKSTVGEYSLSSIGPGPRALRHWGIAKKRGLSIVAKIQTGNTWELSAVPYLPVLENIARHVRGLREAGAQNLMLGWTLGGRPSPNMEAVAEISAGGSLEALAERRYGREQAETVVRFWRECSAAFREFPFNGSVVYQAPLQLGPANPLWLKPTNYTATMVGIPYDDVDHWRGPYPAGVFAGQLEKVASGFEMALTNLRGAIANPAEELSEEMRYAEAAAIHFSSVANQTRFVIARRAVDKDAMGRCAEIETRHAIRLHGLQSEDAQIGFEASNQYYYVPLDLVEKTINARWIEKQLGGARRPD